MKQFKPIRFITFFAATIALAKFFEAGRVMSDEQTFAGLAVSIVSFLGLVLLLFVMGYWIYEEEKEKGNLRVKFGIYEWMYDFNRRRQGQK